MSDHHATYRPEDGKQKDGSSNINGSLGERTQYQINGNLSMTERLQADSSTFAGDFSTQLPPEVAQITIGYLPLSDLITRLVQETFNGIAEVINEMSEMQMPQSNGSIPVTPSHVQKKTKLLDFAQDRRAKFIKILVLSQWSRRAESISRVIDLKAWLDAQTRQYDGACSWIGELRRIMAFERMPDPDLKTALEALSLGNVPGLPDLGYLPPKQVPPQRLLKALRGINTQLTIRLRLHESIPPPLKKYSISNGRVTFRVPNEFEVDLSLADENPSSQLYFIDFRFSFSPTPAGIAQGPLRNDLEARINILLGHDGLKGCYEFLHNFILSHKLNIFRHQAYRLSRSSWSEHLKVEAVHRSLIIQYWVTRPRTKSWIELGIRRRKVKRSSWLHEEEVKPHIGIRWFCNGKEVADVPLIIDLGDLSVETILKQIISAHTNAIFKEIRMKLREGHLYDQKILKLKHSRSTAEPAAISLSVQLTISQSCTVTQEPVSGRVVLLPPSSLYSRAERDINGLISPEKMAASCLANLRSLASCEEVERTLRCHGWAIVNSCRPNQDNMRHHFGRYSLRASFFRRKSWDAQWLLAFTASLAGDSWWIVELDNSSSRADQTGAPGPSIRAAFKVPSTAYPVTLRQLSYPNLLQLEVTAAGMISQYTDSRQLALQKFPHRLVKTNSTRPTSLSPAFYVKFPQSSVKPALKTPKLAKMSSRLVHLSFVGIDESDSYAVHLVTAQSNCATLRSRSLDSMDRESLAFHPTSGAFVFRLRTAVGKSVIPGLLDCLAKIHRLIEYISVVQASKIPKFSLSHVEFTYATEPDDLRAKITFIGEGPPQISFESGNPHLRIQHQLTLLLQGPNGLKHVILLLSMTLPLMRSLVAMETVHGDDKVTILSRSAEWYQILLPNHSGRFDVRLRRRRGEFMWFIEEAIPAADGKKINSRVHQHFHSMINEKGDGWSGMSPGIVASLSGVQALLKRMDDIFQNSPAIEPAPTSEVQGYKTQKRKREDEEEIVVLD
ncbi:MAG: hypothetical protein Q9221_006439 [Calogaya cf. arnoldii]